MGSWVTASKMRLGKEGYYGAAEEGDDGDNSRTEEEGEGRMKEKEMEAKKKVGQAT